MLPRAFDVYASDTAQTPDHPFFAYFAGPGEAGFADTLVIDAPALLLALGSRRRGLWTLLAAALLLEAALCAVLALVALLRTSRESFSALPAAP